MVCYKEIKYTNDFKRKDTKTQRKNSQESLCLRVAVFKKHIK